MAFGVHLPERHGTAWHDRGDPDDARSVERAEDVAGSLVHIPVDLFHRRCWSRSLEQPGHYRLPSIQECQGVGSDRFRLRVRHHDPLHSANCRRTPVLLLAASSFDCILECLCNLDNGDDLTTKSIT